MLKVPDTTMIYYFSLPVFKAIISLHIQLQSLEAKVQYRLNFYGCSVLFNFVNELETN